ncbi:type I-F CRISPR-associated protein Csy2 [Microbulbifer sp.]|uniref:type I-F CRISPR-associated protein Csy2 n=1 Tax=Microbulbifer sp. TaxID=1908541 RepID=UPI00258D41D9|nr:type I-F CRISPR-associated protein Csy2 [Microbulbifer sp.]
MADIHSLLVIPNLYIQNANAISGPMTWGFPSMSAFVGLMHALERRLPDSLELLFDGVGVVCHGYEAQATDGFTRAFHLTRNPVDKKGATAAIVEEGRIHLEISLIFAVRWVEEVEPRELWPKIAAEIDDLIAGMRIAGGSVMPSRKRKVPRLISLADDSEQRDREFQKLKYQLLPGFALIQRDDLLQSHLTDMQLSKPDSTVLDAWLDLSRLNVECRLVEEQGSDGEVVTSPLWEVRRPRGWIVPIPAGYAAISDLLPPGSVANARDTKIPFHFVESLYSVGQWLSPHRLQVPQDLIWSVESDPDQGMYRLVNNNHLQTER